MPAPIFRYSHTPRASSTQPLLRLSYLDGLRAVAALVVISHLWEPYTHSIARPGITGFLTNWLDDGHRAVSVFIVLSGFCLMLPVARSRTLRGGWRAFYKSRARRILPPLYAAIAFAIVKTLLRDHHIPLQVVLVNVFLLQDLTQVPKALDGPLWSVALEWKIYFLFPLLVWLWIRFGSAASLCVGAVISAVLLVLYTQSHLIDNMRFACPWYVLLFTLGMTSADFACRVRLPAQAQRTAWIIILMALVLGWAQVHLWPSAWSGSLPLRIHAPLADILDGIVVSTFLFLLTRRAVHKLKSPILTPVLSVLSWPALVFIGTFSYSIYLTHFLVIYAIHDALIPLLHTQAPYVIIPIDIAVVLPIAYLFHLAFERPFMSKPGTKIKTEAQAEAAAIAIPAP